MTQTAVEWLIDQLRGTDEKGDFIFNGVITSELIEQAKEMEKWQRMKFEIPELSDEEIIKAIHKIYGRDNEDFLSGADWYREQLKQRQ